MESDVKSYQTEMINDDLGVVFIPQRDLVKPDKKEYKYITYTGDLLNTVRFCIVKPEDFPYTVGEVIKTKGRERVIVKIIKTITKMKLYFNDTEFCCPNEIVHSVQKTNK